MKIGHIIIYSIVVIVILSITGISGYMIYINGSMEKGDERDIINDNLKDNEDPDNVNRSDDNLKTDEDGIEKEEKENENVEDQITKKNPVAVLEISGTPIDGFEDVKFVYDISEEMSVSTALSHDQDGEIIEYVLETGVNRYVSNEGPIEIFYTYDYPGVYNLTLTVLDNDHLENTTSIQIMIAEEWGFFAEQIITDKDYKEMLIEFDLFGNVGSNENSINLLIERIRNYCDKPDGIQTTITKETEESIPIESLDDLWKTMMFYRDEYTDDNTLVIYVMYFDHDYQFGDVLGLTFESTSFAIFKGLSFDYITDETYSEEEVEQSILIHEFFHLCGLVNKGYQSDTPHESKRILHKHHCMNKDCVMYYQLERYDLKNYFTGELPNDICDLCQEDMKRYE